MGYRGFFEIRSNCNMATTSNRMLIVLLSPPLFVLLISASFVFGQVVEKSGEAIDSDVVVLECESILQHGVSEDNEVIYVAPISLEPLEAGREYVLRITVYNRTTEDVPFSRIRVDCACAKLEANRDRIPANGEAKFKMHLTAPNSISKNTIVTRAKFVDHEAGKLKFQINVQYSLSGVFSFSEQRFSIDIPEGENLAVARLPVVITAPLSIQQLELSLSENLRDVSAKLLKDPDNEELAFVEVIATEKCISQGSLLGTIDLIHKTRSGVSQKTSTFITIQQKPSIAISPESVRLIRDNHTKPFSGSAILRVNATIPPAEGDGLSREKTQLVPRIELSINGVPAKLTTKPMGGSGIYRVAIEYEGPTELDENGAIAATWVLSFNGNERVVKTHAFFPTLNHERKGER